MLRLPLVLMALFASPVGAGGFINGNDLYRECSSDSAFKEGICLGYIAAISDAMEDVYISGFRACYPTGVTTGQVTDIVRSFLKNNPAERHYRADGVVAQALSEAFPC